MVGVNTFEANTMKRSHFYLILLALIAIVFLNGCISLVEEITVNEDGSGLLRFDLGIETEYYAAYEEAVPTGYELEDLFAVFENDENVTSIKFDRFSRDNLTWESVEISVENVMAAFGQSRKIGPLTIEFDEEGGEYRFIQNINVANSTLNIPGVNLMDLSDSSYVVRLVTPQIVSTNGIQQTAGISSWKIPLDEILQQGSSAFLRANFLLEPYEGFFIPWEVFFPYLVIGFLALCFGSILLVIVVNTVKKRDNEPTLKW